ncbi:thioredoxin peroxidase DOT5 [Aspergillus foveolatus]|uniref:thioredoxin peroxidase DOT5 n=1 Tax=Aspergillus foveolatus TaxID=210207 RepID=UPI003CCDE7B4
MLPSTIIKETGQSYLYETISITSNSAITPSLSPTTNKPKMVELRKRKTTAPPPVQSAKRTRTKVPATTLKPTGNTTASTSENILRVGDVVNLNGFGGDFETNDGRKTTLKSLVDESKAGVVLFTYPKASTPGCTKQACLFRDGFDKLTSTGLAIYGLSADSPKANTNFKSRQNLPYPLLSDTASTLIGAIGFKKSPRGTIRGVFVIDKAGKILLLQPGGPDATVEAVQQLVLSMPKEVQGGIAET